MIKNLVYNNTINEYFFEQKSKEIDTTFCGKKLNFLNSVLPYHKQIKNKLLLKTLFLETIREEHVSNISDDLLEMVQDIYNKNINLDEFQEFELNSIFSLLKKISIELFK